MLQGPIGLVPTSFNSCHSQCRNNLSNSLCLADVTWWSSCSNRSIAFWRSESDQVVAACQTLIRRTWNCLHFVQKTISAPSTMAYIAGRILWIICSHHRLFSVAHRSSTVAFAEFDIFYSGKMPLFRWNRFSASSSALRDRFEWFCWLTSSENSHNARTAPITNSSEADSAAAFQSHVKQTGIEAQFTASVPIIRRIF
jgi:hypothetical protein